MENTDVLRLVKRERKVEIVDKTFYLREMSESQNRRFLKRIAEIESNKPGENETVEDFFKRMDVLTFQLIQMLLGDIDKEFFDEEFVPEFVTKIILAQLELNAPEGSTGKKAENPPAEAEMTQNK